MKIIGPAEVRERNIITQSELKAAVASLNTALQLDIVRRADRRAIKSLIPKLHIVLDQINGQSPKTSQRAATPGQHETQDAEGTE